MKAFYIIEKTCYRRREETSLVRNFFLSNDWVEAGQLSETDSVVFFACSGLRYLSEEKLKEIRETRQQLKLGAELIVGGCLPGMDTDRLRSVFDGKVITPTDFAALNGLPGIKVRIEDMPAIWGGKATCQPLQKPRVTAAAHMLLDNVALESLKFAISLRPHPGLKRIALRLQRQNTIGFAVAAGCPRKCSYCAKPFASGKLRSKPLEAVVDKILEGLRFGYRRFDLYADSIGVYGQDQNRTLGDLLERLLAIDKRFSVGLFDVHPQDFVRYFDSIHRLCQARKLHYVYVAIQSGSNRILKLMKRPCDLEELAVKLGEIRRHENVFMQSGIIAGFPGETDAEFEETLRLLERIRFDDVYVHYYCDMPNTEGSALPDKIGRDAMVRRLAAVKRAHFKHSLRATQHEWEANLALPVLD